MFRLDSLLMRMFKKIGLESIAWSLRRVHCPVHKDALVLEVGSGGNPYARANVLLDAYEVTRERHWAPLISDRPTVLGFVENLPFKDKSFDFVIASHVLEHSSDPAKFLNELQRVAKAGYIEVPDAFLERLNPYRDHRLEVTLRNEQLLIRKKRNWIHDPDVVDLYENRVKSILTRKLIPQNPFNFHVRYLWDQEINFFIINPDDDAAWASVYTESSVTVNANFKTKIKDYLLGFLRYIFSQRSRNKKIDISTLLRCPTCHESMLELTENTCKCTSCGKKYKLTQNIPHLFA